MAPLLFGSGFCALAYQIAWQREFRLVFGASTAASAAVIAVFMGGLGLGAWVLGPRVDRRANPLRFYAALEALVALSAAATPPLFGLVRGVYLRLGGSEALGPPLGAAVRIVLTALVLLVPTVLAGGTLGAAARAVEHEGDRRRRGTAVLYGVNTLGALAGCLVATFWALEALGTRRTLWWAAVVNAILAGAAAVSSRRWTEAADPVGEEGADTAPSAPPGFVLVAAAVVGFTFFLMELVWYRMLGPILGGTVYTFGIVLATALAGIGLGGALYPALAARAAPGLALLAGTCVAEAALVALPWAIGDPVALAALALRPDPGTATGLWSFASGWLLVTAMVVFPPSVVAGAQFPLLVALLGRGRARVARHVGRAYGWNTVGAIAGALAGGFGLLPALTAPGCWRLAALLLCALGVAALAIDGSGPPRRRVALATGAALVALALAIGEGPTAAWRHTGIGAGRATRPAAGANGRRAWLEEARRSIVWEREGVESSVALQELAGLSFVINGKVDGNARNDAPTQVMSGLLGTLLRPGVRRALVVGLGTGSTAGWLASVPGLERTDVVELEPAIVEAARRSAPVNQDVLDNPRVRLVFGDARETLTTGRDRYDLVFSEPSNPYRAGVASLFTREFYRSVSERLEDEGVFLQWVQAYEVDERTIDTVAATLLAVFPEVEIWQVHRIDLVFVASKRPLARDTAALRRRIREEPFATALRAAWRATTLEDVLARFVGGPALARRLAAQAPELNTDDRNPVEFAFARTLSRPGLFEPSRLRRLAREAGADRSGFEGDVDWPRVRRQRPAIEAIAGHPAAAEDDAPADERARAEAQALAVAGDLAGAVRALGGADAVPESAVETEVLAEGLAEAGDPRATAHIHALSAVNAVEAEAATARLALRLGTPDVARDALAAAFVHYRTDPWPSQVTMARALALAVELAVARPETAPVLLQALGRPFAVAALEEPRRLVRIQIASLRPPTEQCREVLADVEPHVPWREDVLRFRSRCYAATRDPRAAQAAADLAEHARAARP